MSYELDHLKDLSVTKQQLREEYVADNWNHLRRVIDIVRNNCEAYRPQYRDYMREENPHITDEQVDIQLNGVIDRFLYKVGDKIIDIVLHKGDDFTVDINSGEFRDGLFTCNATLRWTNGDGFDVKTSIRWNRHSVQSNDFFCQYPLTFSRIPHAGVVSNNTAQLDVGNLFGVPEWAAPSRYLKKLHYRINKGSVVLLSDNTLGVVTKVHSYLLDRIAIIGENGQLVVPHTAILAVLGNINQGPMGGQRYTSWFGNTLTLNQLNPGDGIHSDRWADHYAFDLRSHRSHNLTNYADRHGWGAVWQQTFGNQLQQLRDDAPQILQIIEELRVFARHRSTTNRFFMISENAQTQRTYVEFVPTPIADSMFVSRSLRRVEPVPVHTPPVQTEPTPVADGIWKKLRDGAWGLLVQIGVVRAGDAVRVTKRCGTTSVEVIDQVIEQTPHGTFCVPRKKEYRRHG